MSNSAVFVPHFHWDREWYEPFQVFRHRLVAALDTVLETAEANPGFRFTVDGQMAAIEDYLEMRPENRDRVVALVTEGRIAIGPWLILLDEFLCSGETIVRNLRMGWSAAAKLGGAMPVGYLPDMFGHVAQMPQILARAGFEHAALWRGVPAAIEGHAFRWRAPDGSEVRTEFLFDGYDNGLDVLLVPDRVGRALGDYAEMTAARWGSDPVLAMAGTDHNAPDPDLAAWLRRASGEGRPSPSRPSTNTSASMSTTRCRPSSPASCAAIHAATSSPACSPCGSLSSSGWHSPSARSTTPSV